MKFSKVEVAVSKLLRLLVLFKKPHYALAWDCRVNKLKWGHNCESGLPWEGLTQLRILKTFIKRWLRLYSTQYKSPARAHSQQRRGSDYSTGFKKNKFQRVYSVLRWVRSALFHRHTHKKHLIWTIAMLMLACLKIGFLSYIVFVTLPCAEDVFNILLSAF